MIKTNKITSLGIVAAAYVAGFTAAWLTGKYFHAAGTHPLLTVLWADLACTVIVFVFTYLFKNTSIYDPYWSIIPIPIALWLASLNNEPSVSVRAIAGVSLVTFWGVRLTWNWVRRWSGLAHIDWRYVDFEQKTGAWFWLVSFAGLQLVPTLFVYLGCLPLYPALAVAEKPFGWLDGWAAALVFGAILLELVADNQLVAFQKRHREPGEVCTEGLWAYCRFPNYLGEIAFWWGLFFLGLFANTNYAWTVVGAVVMTALFQFISIPMMEKRHIARRPAYAEVMKKIPRWPWLRLLKK
jgi:steroid 5-alpha reductase family enzyme